MLTKYLYPFVVLHDVLFIFVVINRNLPKHTCPGAVMGSSSSKQEQKATSTPYKHVWEVQGVKDIDGNTVDMSKFNNKVRTGCILNEWLYLT